MAKGKKGGSKKTVAIVVAIALVLGLPVALLATQQNGDLRQHASQFNDLNTSFAITETTNEDGTMGPLSYLGNYTNRFPSPYLGTLNFQVTDPVQGKPPTIPTHVMPTQAQANGFENATAGGDEKNNTGDHGKPTTTSGNTNNNQGGPQAVSSLTVTISKVEVHLAHVGLPGTKNELTPVPSGTPTPSQAPGKPSPLNQGVNKWETLNIGAPKTLDLVQLAKTHALSSLGLTTLVNGRYTEVRLYISSGSATLQNGTKVALVIPGKKSIVRVVQSFVIDSQTTTTLTMDFDAQNSVIKAGDTYLLKPVIAHLLEQ